MRTNKQADLLTSGFALWRAVVDADLDRFLRADLTSAESFRWLCELTGRTHPAYHRHFRDRTAIYIGVEPRSPSQIEAAMPEVSPQLSEEARRLSVEIRRGWLLPGSEPGALVVKGAVRAATFVQFYVDLQKLMNEVWTRSMPHIAGQPTTTWLLSQTERRDARGESARKTFGDRQAAGSYLDRLAYLCQDLRLDFERDSDHPAHVLRKWPLRSVFVAESLAGALAHLLHQRLVASVVRGVCPSCGRPIVTQPHRGRPPKTCRDVDCMRRLRQRRRARARAVSSRRDRALGPRRAITSPRATKDRLDR